MGRLTPFGTLLLLAFIVIVGGGFLALTDNLRWPPFGITFQTAPPGVTPGVTPGATALSDGGAAAFTPIVAQTAPPGEAPPPTESATPPPSPTPSATATSTPTPMPTATATPQGLAYVGAIDMSGPPPGAGGPQPAATDPDTGRLFVASSNGRGVAVLGVYEEATLKQQTTIPLDLPGVELDTLAPVPVIVHTPSHRIYVVARSGRVATVDSTSLAPGPLYNFGMPVERAFISPDGTKLYGLIRDEPGSGGPLLRVIDVKNINSKGIRIPARWTADAAFTDGPTLYVTGRDGLLPIDMRSGSIGAPITLGFQPLFPLFDAANHRLYTWRQPQTVPFTPELLVIDSGPWQVTAKMTRAGCPCPLATSSQRKRLYLADPSTPGHVLAFNPDDKFATHDEVILDSVPAIGALASTGTNRIYVQISGPHAIIALQDNGPAPAGRNVVTVPVK
jgi:hypothetical protein